MVCIRVALKAPLSFELDLCVTVQTEVRTCFDMEALNVSHEVLLSRYLYSLVLTTAFFHTDIHINNEVVLGHKGLF